jgi:hypothetical protein
MQKYTRISPQVVGIFFANARNFQHCKDSDILTKILIIFFFERIIMQQIFALSICLLTTAVTTSQLDVKLRYKNTEIKKHIVLNPAELSASIDHKGLKLNIAIHEEAEHALINTELFEHGNLISQPTIKTAWDTPAKISIGSKDPEHSKESLELEIIASKD